MRRLLVSSPAALPNLHHPPSFYNAAESVPKRAVTQGKARLTTLPNKREHENRKTLLHPHLDISADYDRQLRLLTISRSVLARLEVRLVLVVLAGSKPVERVLLFVEAAEREEEGDTSDESEHSHDAVAVK